MARKRGKRRRRRIRVNSPRRERRSRRSRRGGGGKMTLEKAISLIKSSAMPAALVGVGILVARAVAGLLRQEQPDLHPGIGAVGGAVAPGLLASLVGAKSSFVLPLIMGGIGGVLSDIAKLPLAEQLATDNPIIAGVIFNGVDLEETISTEDSTEETRAEITAGGMPPAISGFMPGLPTGIPGGVLAGFVPWSESELGDTYLMP